MSTRLPRTVKLLQGWAATSGLSHPAVLPKGAEKGLQKYWLLFHQCPTRQTEKGITVVTSCWIYLRVISRINRLMNNFAFVSLCVMIHLCKIGILVKQSWMGWCLGQDQGKPNWITFGTVSKVRQRTMDLLKQCLDCVSESFPCLWHCHPPAEQQWE